MELATFGAGCYWGTEKFFVKDFQKRFPGSVNRVTVGFMGGSMENPDYRSVCSGKTGHVEVAQVEFDASKARFEDLARFFFTFHDPTTLNRQGNDVGTQYASVIFYHSEEQKKSAETIKAELQTRLSAGGLNFQASEVATEIRKADVFFPAHDEHQAYLEKNPGGYCNHGIRFQW
eukprot:TRINITY_DN5211_c0_g1_i1.p1 TRINITY_DN5211_c0_g1~~TRINITY_DN5211_c0_g1_i1.p1  ORF type:complete len:188 (+),score=30.33 TRINITY_DN5211_c0_g1_i1:42-566(+)